MTIKQYLFITLCLPIPLYGGCIAPNPYFSIRSQGFNTARHISGMSSWQIAQEHDCLFGTINITPEYLRSFGAKKIRHSLFGSDSDCITISGSRADNRGPNDWLADYFYLPTDFQSVISFKPVIDHFLVDFNALFYLDGIAPGLYVYLFAPLVHTRWELNMHEDILTQGANSEDAGYFSPAPIARGMLLPDFTAYAAGEFIDIIVQAQDANNPASEQITVYCEPLNYAQISPKRRMRTRFADLRAVIGYNVIYCDDYWVGLNMHMAFPTGNRPTGHYLFEPMAGNGHHFELGGGFAGYAALWESDCTRVLFRWDATVTHLFGTRQKRVFDLNQQPFSRYMLAERLGTPIIDNLVGVVGGTTQAPTAQFQNNFTPVANLTATCVEVSVDVQADITILFNVSTQNWSWDIGYSFWARSGEKLHLRTPALLNNNQTWALKGDAFVYGFQATAPTFSAIPLSVTESAATINSGTNFPAVGTTDPTTILQDRRNLNVDNPEPAESDITNSGTFTAVVPQPAVLGPSNQQSDTSINPVFLDIALIDPCDGPRYARTLSSKVFTHFNYTFDYDAWMPYIGIGGQIEVCHSSHAKSLSFESIWDCWSIWIKAGVSFE